MQVNYTSYVKPTTFKGSLKKPANKSFNFLNKDSFISAQKKKFYVKDAKEVQNGVADVFKALVTAPISALAFNIGNQSLGIVCGVCSALWGVCSLLAFASGIGKKHD